MQDDESISDKTIGAAFACIDDHWFATAAKRYGFNAAFEIALEAWRDCGRSLVDRQAEALGISREAGAGVGMDKICFMLENALSACGVDCSYRVIDEGTAEFDVETCPWRERLELFGKSRLLNCELVDNTVIASWLTEVDPGLELVIDSSVPRGSEYCSWTLRRV